MKRRDLVSFQNVSNNFSDISDFELVKRRVIFAFINQKILTKIGSFLLKNALRFQFPIKFFIKNSIYQLFCGGENLVEVSKSVERFEKQGIGVILDYGAERATSMQEANLAYNKILETIEYGIKSNKRIIIDFKISSLLNPAILEKKSISALKDTDLDLYEELRKRLLYIGDLCRSNNLPVMIDSEESWIQASIDELTYELMSINNKIACIVYNTIQMYRIDGPNLLKTAIEQSKQKGYILGVKLVRGAYMEKERERAASANLPSPIWKDKNETDHAFDQGIKICLDNYATTRICCASHNEQSVLNMIQLMDEMNIEYNNEIGTFAQLMGMSDHITFGLAKWGFGVYKYMPYGKVNDIMPYLIRRAEENTSVAGQTSRELQLIKNEIARRKSVR